MTITNGYATLAEYKTYQRVTSTDVNDDAFIETAIEASSRWIDRESGTQFFSSTETRKYDVPENPRGILLFDAYFTAVTAVVNGDGSTLAASDYVTLPANRAPLYGVQLKQNSGVIWTAESTGNKIQAIAITGSVGHSATAPKDVYLSCLEIARALYSRRFGENMTTKTIITSAGVVQIPEGVPDWAAMTIANYRRVGFA